MLNLLRGLRYGVPIGLWSIPKQRSKTNMHLKRLDTRNFRLLENVTIEFHPEVTVLIGANYAGKSSVVEAFLFLRDSTFNPGFAYAFSERGNFEGLVSWRDSARILGLETLSTNAGQNISYKVSFDSQGLREEEISIGGTPIYSAQIDASSPGMILFPNGQTSRSFGFTLLSRGLPSVHPVQAYFAAVVNVDPFRNVQFQGAVGPKELIQPTGLDLSQVLHYHYNNDRERFDAYELHVRRVLPEVDIIETPLVSPNHATVSIRFIPSPVKFRLSSLSSGIKDVLVLLAAAHFSPQGSLILIEEPENHLHPTAQKVLCAVFAGLARSDQKQFVLTTHSEFILGQFDPSQSVFIERVDSGSRAIPLASVDAYTAWQGLGIERTRLLEVLGRTRQVVVVTESRNDAKIIDALARNEHDISDKLLPVRADGGGPADIIQHAAQLREALTRFRIPSAVFAAIAGTERADVEGIIARAEGAGKPRLDWVLDQLRIKNVPLDLVVNNACKSGSDPVPSEFNAVIDKLRALC